MHVLISTGPYSCLTLRCFAATPGDAPLVSSLPFLPPLSALGFLLFTLFATLWVLSIPSLISCSEQLTQSAAPGHAALLGSLPLGNFPLLAPLPALSLLAFALLAILFLSALALLGQVLLPPPAACVSACDSCSRECECDWGSSAVGRLGPAQTSAGSAQRMTGTLGSGAVQQQEVGQDAGR